MSKHHPFVSDVVSAAGNNQPETARHGESLKELEDSDKKLKQSQKKMERSLKKLEEAQRKHLGDLERRTDAMEKEMKKVRPPLFFLIHHSLLSISLLRSSFVLHAVMRMNCSSFIHDPS